MVSKRLLECAPDPVGWVSCPYHGRGGRPTVRRRSCVVPLSTGWQCRRTGPMRRVPIGNRCKGTGKLRSLAWPGILHHVVITLTWV